jgi:prevent-host-death family protein
LSTDIWTLTKTKERFREVIERAQTRGPQTVTRRGRPAVVIVSAAEWERIATYAGTLAAFFAASPLRGSGIIVDRRTDKARPITL